LQNKAMIAQRCQATRIPSGIVRGRASALMTWTADGLLRHTVYLGLRFRQASNRGSTGNFGQEVAAAMAGKRKYRSFVEGFANGSDRPEARVPEVGPVRAERARKLP
jgi:hypothetical protein